MSVVCLRFCHGKSRLTKVEVIFTSHGSFYLSNLSYVSVGSESTGNWAGGETRRDERLRVLKGSSEASVRRKLNVLSVGCMLAVYVFNHLIDNQALIGGVLLIRGSPVM